MNSMELLKVLAQLNLSMSMKMTFFLRKGSVKFTKFKINTD